MPHRAKSNIPSQVYEIQKIGTDPGEDRDPAVDDIVALIPDKDEHQHDARHLEQDRAYRDVGILFQPPVHPLHADRVKEDRDTHDGEKREVRAEPRDVPHRYEICGIGDNGDQQVDDQDLLNRPREFLLVIPHLRDRPDPVGRHAQHGDHAEIRDKRHREINAPHALRQQDTGDIGKRNQRKDHVRCGKDHVHDEVEPYGSHLYHCNRPFSASLPGTAASSASANGA